jgi:cephalosporin-C deacetylase
VGELRHSFPFDPTYGYDLDALLAVDAPPEPPGFRPFWSRRYKRAVKVDPAPVLAPSAHPRAGFLVSDVEYRSTEGFPIRGWLLEPATGPVRAGFVVGHGYGGLEKPDFDLPRGDAVYLAPCFRGLARSSRAPISTDPVWHVLHDIHLRDRYIVGGCVEDVWTAVTTLLRIRPDVEGRVGYIGHSFGGGIGALALPWERRVARAHLDVPTFGHHPLRLRLPTIGSAAAVQGFARGNRHVVETLAYFDAAVAARYIRVPTHVSAALFDPAVVPPGQFAIYNALPSPKDLFVRSAGHFEYTEKVIEDAELRAELREFFESL